MNTKSNVYLNTDARDAIMRGVNATADAVKVTLGAAGANAILEAGVQPGHLVTNDGVSIAQMVFMDDPVEQIGANLIKEIATRSDAESGDGTTTATVLAQAILEVGLYTDEPPMDIKNSLNEALLLVNTSLDEQKKTITVNEVEQVATVSAEDAVLGKMIGDIYKEIGPDGIIEIDTSNLPTSYHTVTDGVRLRGAGYLGAYSTTEPGKAVYKNPKVLVAKDKIASLEDIEPIVKALANAGKNELVIFCDDVDIAVANRLALTHLQGNFKTLLIKAPTLWKDWLTEDFARITGATVVNAQEGVTWKNLLMAHLGTCEQVITTATETRVIGIQDISQYLATLNASTNPDDKLRASWLQTKVATLRLGANSETELSYLMKKAEDARSAAYLALQDGIVAGGGIALFNAIKCLPNTVGGNILKLALVEPVRQICINAGHVDMEFVDGDFGGEMGYDAKQNKIVNMWEAGIVDPVRVVKNSLKNAVSVAGTVLTTKVVITLHKENEATTKVPTV